MPFEKQVKDIMIPIDRYPVVDADATLKDAVSSLRKSYCSVETGFCSETGPRTVLVVDRKKELVGVLDFRTILSFLIPETTGSFSKRFEALEISLVFAQAGVNGAGTSKAGIVERIRTNARTPVKEVMLKSLGHTEPDASLVDAMKIMFSKKLIVLPVFDGNRLVGVVRDADLFLAAADLFLE